ncbi:MAG: NTPase [Desulfurococcaceae archaeon TW002]
MKFFISGPPGVGKTTVFLRVIELLRNDGLKIGGFICPEVRRGGQRVGFKIIDLMSSDEDWLAKLCVSGGPRIGKYCVNTAAATAIGVNAIKKALENADLIAIDEIGPMELSVSQLKSAIYEVLKSNRVLLAVIHWKLKDSLLKLLSSQWELFLISISNRDWIHKTLYSKIRASLY